MTHRLQNYGHVIQIWKKISMEEEEEEEEDDGLTHEQLTDAEGSAGAGLSTPRGGSGNPAFVPEDNAEIGRAHV